MKKMFPVIIGLISLSLIGIILIQMSWISNMVTAREEQFEDKVIQVTLAVGQELSQYKGSSLNIPGKEAFNLDILRQQPTIGSRFTSAELYQMIRNAFVAQRLDEVPFEFALATTTSLGMIGYYERLSPRFEKKFADTSKNFAYLTGIVPPGGSFAENLSANEILIVVVPDIKNIILQTLRWPIITAIIFTIMIFAAFFLTVSAMLRQKKLSEIKNDFINNMTHEFKTPLATISLAVDAMRNEKVMSDKEKMTYFNSIIKEENQRMNRQVETILKAALLDKQEVDLLLKPTHVHEVIREAADNFALQLESKKGKIDLALEAKNDMIDADDVHFSNLITNLIDNAVKYAKENVPPEIKIGTQANGKNMILKMEDNGIGMSKETVKRIFEKFYRAHTGNLHNVKGFGLGLSYVKTMIHAHGGDIKVDSTLGKGSTFTIELPLKKNMLS